MSNFLLKTRQKVEHTGKINVGEFKLLGAVIGSEKNLLNSHVRVSGDCKKAATALDEWAQAEGIDLAVSEITVMCKAIAYESLTVVYAGHSGQGG